MADVMWITEDGTLYQGDRASALDRMATEAEVAAFQATRPNPIALGALEECKRRIYAVASDNAQKNMLANAVLGLMSDSDKLLLRAGTLWIGSMQVACRELIVAQDDTYADDGHWPTCPEGVAELASRY